MVKLVMMRTCWNCGTQYTFTEKQIKKYRNDIVSPEHIPSYDFYVDCPACNQKDILHSLEAEYIN